MRRCLAAPLVVLVVGVGLVGCTEEGRDQLGEAIGGGQEQQEDDGVESPAEPAEPAAPEEPAEPAAPEEPAEPAAPEEPAEPEDDVVDEAETTSVVLLAVLLLGMFVVAFLVFRRTTHEAPAEESAPGLAFWRSRVRQAYAEARWVQDHFHESVAARRGEAMALGQNTDVDDPDAREWRRAASRVPALLDELYALEADAPGPDQRTAVQELGRAVREVDVAARALANRFRDEPRDRAGVLATASDAMEGDVRGVGVAEADQLRAARRRLSGALSLLQAFLPDART